MFAEIITIGDELLIGQVVDTNSAWIGRKLNEIGIEVLAIVSVRDRENEIIEALDDALSKVDVVLITGGLGPTKDDITKQTLCKYFNTELVFSQEVFENIQRILGERKMLNKLNTTQAMVPKDCKVINNPVGTASVSWFEKRGKIVVSMPGVPQEMKAVMNESILGMLQGKSKEVILHQNFFVQHYSESALAEKLKAWECELPPCLKLAYLPQFGIVHLRLTARGGDKHLLEKQLEQQKSNLECILGKAIYSEEDGQIEKIIGELLMKAEASISTAESCSGGNLSARFTSVPGCSRYVRGGVVAYANEVKTNVLHVSPETLMKHGAVSEQTVIEMVKGAIDLFGTDYAIATSGIAGPGGGTTEKPVGTIWIAVGSKENILTYKQETNFGRITNVERAVNNALLMFYNILSKNEQE